MPKKKLTKPVDPITEELKTVYDQMREVNFWICVNFADLIKRYCDITTKTDDVSPLHAIAMWHLACAGGTTTPSRMAETMLRSKHSVTKIVDNLEKEGLIIRDFSSRDRRVTKICVTQAGLQYIKNSQDISHGAARKVMDCLTDEQQKILIELMEIMQNRMNDILAKLQSRSRASYPHLSARFGSIAPDSRL
jgi:DNA-binding MarR family transcriptional regulator